VQTYPLVLNLSSGIYGYAGDSLAIIIHFRQLSDSLGSPALGKAFRYVRPVTDGLGALLTRATGPVAAYNLLLLASYAGTAITTYLLAMRITRSHLGAMLAAFVFTFCPYRLLHSYGHLYLAGTQWLPLYVLALLRLREKPTFPRTVQLGAVILLVGLSSFYYGYYAVLMFVPLVLSLLLHPAPSKGRFVALAACSFGPAAIASRLLFRHRVEGIISPQAPTEKLLYDLFVYSARPLEYIVPHASGLWRSVVLSFWRNNLHGSNEVEQALFLGYIPLVLAAVAVGALLRRRAPRWPMALSLTLTLCAVALTAPPAFGAGGLRFYGPSFFLSSVFPAFRVYARAGALAYLGVALLAGLGWAALQFSRPRVRWLPWALVVTATLAEYTNVPPFRFLSLEPRPVHRWLRDVEGTFSIVEYPLPPPPQRLTGRRFYYALFHGKKSRTHLSQADLSQIRVLDASATALMGEQGVRFVIFHSEPLDRPRDIVIDGMSLPSVPPAPQVVPGSGLRLVGRVGGATVYEVSGWEQSGPAPGERSDTQPVTP
jgi:hypothetical protein